MQLTDLCSIEEWKRFERELHERYNMNCTVYDTSGAGLTGRPHWCNRLCPEIKANEESLSVICAPGNQNFMARAEKTRQPVVGECDAGLVKVAVPIFVDGEFLGTAGGCGRLPVGGEVETFLIGKTTGIDEERLLQLCAGLQPITEQKAKEMADYIERRIARCVDAVENIIENEAHQESSEDSALGAFLENWRTDPSGVKPAFLSLAREARSMEGVAFTFHERPGISYSLRLAHVAQSDRPLFAMIDVIDDDPGNRWLSVCFFGDMIEDPEEQGDLVPGGLLGADGHCFDITDGEETFVAYVATRMQEAYKAARSRKSLQ